MVVPEIDIRCDDFDITAVLDAARDKGVDVGAIVSFTGLCRSDNGRLAALELEHYPAMAKSELTAIAESAMEKWPLTYLHIAHRHGKIAPGENIVLVVTAAGHRAEAFQAAEFVMDFLKTSAPFWKKEHCIDGTEGNWVEARTSDDAARERWADE